MSEQIEKQIEEIEAEMKKIREAKGIDHLPARYFTLEAKLNDLFFELELGGL